MIGSKKLPADGFDRFEVLLGDEVWLAVEEEQRSPPLPLLEQQVPALLGAVKGGAQDLQ